MSYTIKFIERSRVCHNHKLQPTLDTKRKRKRTKTYTRKTNKLREAQRPAPSSQSEVIRMLKQMEKRRQRAREDFKTPSAPWYKPRALQLCDGLTEYDVARGILKFHWKKPQKFRAICTSFSVNQSGHYT